MERGLFVGQVGFPEGGLHPYGVCGLTAATHSFNESVCGGEKGFIKAILAGNKISSFPALENTHTQSAERTISVVTSTSSRFLDSLPFSSSPIEAGEAGSDGGRR